MHIRALRDPDQGSLGAFLRADPVANIYLLGLLANLPPSRLAGTIWGAHEQGRRGGLGALVYLSTGGLAVPAGGSPAGIEALGDHLASGGAGAVRILVGTEDAVDPIWWCLGRSSLLRPPRLRRRHLLLELPAAALQPGPAEAGLHAADLADLQELVLCSAAMRQEELGDDVLATNADGFRRWLRQRVEARRCWVLRDSAGIAFKADVGSLSPHGVQIEGVYTRPDRRGEGLCTRALRGLCASLLRIYPRATLHVWEHNHPARRVYRRLGFRYDRPYRVILR